MGVILEANGLAVRAFVPEDAAAVVSWMAPAPMDLFMVSSGFVFPLTSEAFLQYAAKTDGSQHLLYSVFEADNGTHVGHFEIKNISTRHKNGTGAHIIVSPGSRKSGVGRRLMECLATVGFDQLGLERLSLSLHTINIPAAVLYLKSGYQFEGIIRDALFFEGRRYSLYQMALLKSEWKGAK